MSMSRQRVLRLALAVLLGLVLALAIDLVRVGGVRLWLARHGLPPPYLAQGELVELRDGSFYLDCRGDGSPTVVLEAGAGTGAGSWSGVIGDIAATTRTCAYDRAGLGRSDARGTRTLGASAADLRALLARAGEPPPFVVVGLSLGGSYARVFASAHRSDTAAVVLLEPFNPDLQRAFVHPLLGPLAAEYDATLDRLGATVEVWERLDWPTSEAQLREASLDGLRVAVLVARRYEPRVDGATNERLRKAWIEAYEQLSPGRVSYEYADDSGHLIPMDRPDLVVQLVRQVVDEVRSGP